MTSFQNLECSAANGFNGTCLTTVIKQLQLIHLIKIVDINNWCCLQAECSGVGGFASGACAQGNS